MVGRSDGFRCCEAYLSWHSESWYPGPGPGQKTLEALQQITWLLTTIKFSILTNWKQALFLHRVETSGRKTLEYYLLELGGPMVGISLLAEDGFASTEQKKAICKENGYLMRPDDDAYRCFCFSFFDLSSSRPGHGTKSCVVNGRLLRSFVQQADLHVIYKIVDVLHHCDVANLLDHEAWAYVALQQNLQDQVIPIPHGYFEVCGILRLFKSNS